MRFEISPICSSVKLFSAGCSVTSKASDKPSGVFEPVEQANAGDRRLVGAADRAEQRCRQERRRGTMKAKSRVTACSAGGA